MSCRKLDPYTCTCSDHPGTRCLNVPFGQCKPDLAVDKPDKPKKENPL